MREATQSEKLHIVELADKVLEVFPPGTQAPVMMSSIAAAAANYIYSHTRRPEGIDANVDALVRLIRSQIALLQYLRAQRDGKLPN